MGGREGLALSTDPGETAILMKPSRRIIEAIFFGAASLADANDRREYLRAACGGDAQLLAAVEEMLAAQDDAERFFAKGASGSESPAPGGGEALPDFDERLGERIGRYKLLQKIGEGGWGAIYLAEQEEPVHRRVALKIIKLGMDTRSVIARFEAERQTLALMDHPNIARVLDAGATARGRPFFVMELVNGVKITEFCDANTLGLRQRLELFVQVCHAVQHAHLKGIIHRDLKPSNILVTMADGVPTPKVIDFGIAKAMGGKLADQTVFMAPDQLMGTPAYMSPEQAELSGLDVDTRSDIYSLGALLYELMTGATPFDGRELMSSGVDKMRHVLRETEPPRPSAKLAALPAADLQSAAEHRRTEPVKLISQLTEDLDWIVLKTLEKDRDRRYQTANGLAADVERYLANEPVLARPPSRSYRLKKLVRRNKTAFVAGTWVALALAAGLAASAVMYSRAENARARETELRLHMESRDKLTQAVVLVRQGDYKGAAKLLGDLKVPPTSPTLDGISALRSVGGWLAAQSRWRESADRYSTLLQINKIDNLETVTTDYQGYGAVLGECGDLPGYERFRQNAVARFSGLTNAVYAGRILTACLLPPVTSNTLAMLQPFGTTMEQWTSTLSTNDFTGWAPVPICLWKYRQGDYDATLRYCQRGMLLPVNGSAYIAELHAIAAMAYHQRGQEAEAQAELAEAGHVLQTSLKYRMQHGGHRIGYWPDWVMADNLQREATSLIQPKPPN